MSRLSRFLRENPPLPRTEVHNRRQSGLHPIPMETTFGVASSPTEFLKVEVMTDSPELGEATWILGDLSTGEVREEIRPARGVSPEEFMNTPVAQGYEQATDLFPIRPGTRSTGHRGRAGRQSPHPPMAP